MRRDAARIASFSLILLVLGLGSASPIDAATTRGQVRLGGYTRIVTFKDKLQGEENNDEAVLSGQFSLDALELNDSNDQVVLDFRDKWDSYGKLERQNLRLSSYNRIQMRTLAYRRPWETNRFYFTLGRFALAEANVLSNDGADAGYRLSRSFRLGVFGGQGPKDILMPLYVDPKEPAINNLQAGSYLTYENKGGVEDSSYLTQAVGQGPTYDITDKANHAYYFQQGMWTFTNAHRLATTALYDFKPTSVLRRASISHIFTSEKYRTHLYLQQTNTEDYFLKQTIEDTLKPSPVQTLGFELRQRLLQNLSFDYSLLFGKRTEDGLTQKELAFGILLPRLIFDASSLRTQFGVRNNFQSKDNFVRISYDYWARYIGLGLSHLIVKEDYESGLKNQRQISTIDSSFFLSEDLRGTLAYQIESDDKASAKALFVMIGYRFGEASVSPVRTKTPRFESM